MKRRPGGRPARSCCGRGRAGGRTQEEEEEERRVRTQVTDTGTGTAEGQKTRQTAAARATSTHRDERDGVPRLERVEREGGDAAGDEPHGDGGGDVLGEGRVEGAEPGEAGEHAPHRRVVPEAGCLVCKPRQDAPDLCPRPGHVPDDLPDWHVGERAAKDGQPAKHPLQHAMERHFCVHAGSRGCPPPDLWSLARVRRALLSLSLKKGGPPLTSESAARPSDGMGELKFPKFKHVTQFSLSANAGSSTQAYDFLAQNRGALRSIHLHNLNWPFPAEQLSLRNLTHLDFLGTFAADSLGLAAILAHGTQLESLRLQCVLECATASAQFREHASALPFLRHFAFALRGYRVNDYDLFPALSAFLADRTQLRTLHLTVPSADWAQRVMMRVRMSALCWACSLSVWCVGSERAVRTRAASIEQRERERTGAHQSGGQSGGTGTGSRSGTGRGEAGGAS
ncbi:uncharacterized protein PHACADRAFT_186437 [Phanerochaete carnosa HHB-10118-sp]|uniref:Uncharacterized protein n=1 Tax=Phanerochaete carnosa (strain HHB-10118-sp) TaxID=650164 RepID=K5UQZ3_PHACS|nr:uncharacterized protein PHACADRAFT_186437 [Phanerochaete carnosa HHB-10118-sp]EKM52261.1 hypothetical protein PHACADRAFT_186437 [Phanerochaete carnosa HHB-10118-sp]